ncbi:MAG: hypothetical protein GY860_01925 [Desulfobacteraceae bacterium]|nr:hypothetical protein [Desulfobacteraceae bacterium]
MSQKTVYVLGAGASAEVGLPTGAKLKDKIATLLGIHDKRSGVQGFENGIIADALRSHATNCKGGNFLITPYLQAAEHIQKAMPLHISIDNFIDTQKGNEIIEICGKLSITKAILDAEKESKLFIDPSNIFNRLNFNILTKSWYNSFMMLLTENCRKEELSHRLSSIALIIFNYDRCFEHFVYQALQTSYNLIPTEAAEFVDKIEIYHPYGVVGKLPWQKNGSVSVEYGEKINGIRLFKVAKQIKTFTEGTDPNSSNIVALQESIGKAARIVFLGFAYHRTNLELMMEPFTKDESLKADQILGTANSLSDTDRDFIKFQLSRHCGQKILDRDIGIDNNLKCSAFFNEYWRSLTFI